MLLELPKTPIVQVHTTDNRGFTPEEIARFCVDKIVEVSDKAPQKYEIRHMLLKLTCIRLLHTM